MTAGLMSQLFLFLVAQSILCFAVVGVSQLRPQYTRKGGRKSLGKRCQSAVEALNIFWASRGEFA